MRRSALASIIPIFCLAGVAVADPLFVAGQSPKAIHGWAMRQSPPEPGAFVTTAMDAGFEPYDGNYLPPRSNPGPVMYTFVTDFALDSSTRGVPLAVFMGPGDYPRDVWFNGVLLLRTGDHGDRYNATVYYSSRILLPPQLAKFDGSPNRLSVEAYPAYEQSPLGDFYLGNYYDVTGMVFLRDLFGIHLVRAAVITALIIAFYYLLLFFSMGREHREYLWFALTCFAFALGYSNMSFYSDAANDVVLDKLSRVGLPLTVLFLSFFAIRHTGVGERIKWLKPALSIPALASIALDLVQKDKQGVAGVFGSFTTNFVLTPGLLLVLGIFIAGVVRQRNAASVAVLAGFILAVVASLHDISYVQRHLVPFAYLVAYGYLGQLIAIFFVLALRQAKIAKDLRERTAGLDDRNARLAEVVRDLTGVSEGLVASSETFERTLGETISFVEAYGVENRAILEAFSGQARTVDDVLDRIAERMAVSSERVPHAIEAQAAAVEQVNRTLSEMDARIAANLSSAIESSRIAEELAKNAGEGMRIIGMSHSSMEKVGEVSGSLQGVLGSIEDIAERTHILSINAAIESARLGADGRGFGVVAQEIRKLSSQSSTNLDSSFEKIREMSKAVTQAAELSRQVATTLGGIASQAHDSAEQTADIRTLMDQLRAESGEIMRNASSLLGEARTIQALSMEERTLNEERQGQLRSMKESISSLGLQLEGQQDRARELGAALERMRGVAEQNALHIGGLRMGIEKAKTSSADKGQ